MAKHKRNRRKKKRNDQDSFGELPSLVLNKSKTIAEFTLEQVHLEAKGKTIEEAKEGLSILIQKLKEL